MAFAFSTLCALLNNLEDIETRQPPLQAADKADRVKDTVSTWFKHHRKSIDGFDIRHLVALLSSLFPEKRSDRTYEIQAPTLQRILGRCLGIGHDGIQALQAYKQPGRGDLGKCLQRVMEARGQPALPAVQLIEVDELLDFLASLSRFSDSSLYKHHTPSSSESRDDRVGNVIKRLHGRDAKWLVRMILKDVSIVCLNEFTTLKMVHFLLPDLLRFQDTFKAAATLLKTSLRDHPSTPDPASERVLRAHAVEKIKPEIGVKIGRRSFTKAWSIAHCLKMLGPHKWVLERKYDGEYCEIHVDLAASPNRKECIKIFSKNGKDATDDRKGILDYLVDSLRLGKPDCSIKNKAVLLGELVVWSDLTNAVLPFEEIRKHVTRSGRYLGTGSDSRPPAHEHLCIVLFDLLVLDDKIVMQQSVEKRREQLKRIYDKHHGRVKAAEWKMIDFSVEPERARHHLLQQFAASNASKCEGLVLKPCGSPYFELKWPKDRFVGYIKLKKDYITGLGDEADFAVIGASYDVRQVPSSKYSGIRWTDFHLGTLLNKDGVERYSMPPRYRYVGTIQQQICIPDPILQEANKLAHFIATDPSADDFLSPFDIEDGPKANFVVFREPMVFEVLGSGYVKPPDCDYFMLRHPRVKKLHQDRTWRDCVTFDELQELAENSRTSGVESESQENRNELARLESTLSKKFAVSVMRTPSPKKIKATRICATPMETSLLVAETSLVAKSSSPRLPLQEIAHNTRSSTSSIISPPKRSSARKRKVYDDNDRAERAIKQIRQMETEPVPGSPVPTEVVDIPKEVRRQYEDVIANEQEQHLRCEHAKCLFVNSVVFLAPCIASMPYVVVDLLRQHDAIEIPSWSQWVRDQQRHAADSATIAESQAFPGMQRIVLVESKRPRVVESLIENLRIHTTSALIPSVSFFDWRVLEYIDDHRLSADTKQAHRVGVLQWDDERMTSRFIKSEL